MNNHSETIGKIAAALSKAQAAVGVAKKDSKNPYFSSTYADLESVWEACREALTSNELAVAQTTELLGTDLVLVTLLIHPSGEWIKGIMPIYTADKEPPSFKKDGTEKKKNPAQAMGSSITYARRYALAAMVGVYQADDDAESLGHPQKKQEFVKDVPVTELLKNLKKEIEVPHSQYLGEYLEHCKARVNRPMKEVVASWINKPEPFIEHYARWVSNKHFDGNSEIKENEAM